MTTPTTLDDLAALTSADLGELYADGEVPADFSALDKHPRGRMLAIRGVEKTPFHGLVTEFAKLGFFPWDGNPPSNADCVADPWLPDVAYHALRLSTRVNDQFTFYMGVDNLFDSAPPAGQLGTGAGDPYDPIGRYFYAGATVDF